MIKYLFLSLLFLPMFGFSQQGHQFSQYMLDKYRFIPAYAGMDYSLGANAVVRTQYNELLGNPTSQWVNAHLPYYRTNGALGFQISNQSLGAFRQMGIHASYSYILDRSNFLLAGAIQIGAENLRLDGTALITPDGNYEGSNINHNDPILNNILSNGFAPDVGLSIYLRTQYFEGGLAVNQLIPGSYDIGITGYNRQLEYVFYGQSKISYGGNWQFIPSLLLKTDATELQTDLSILAKYNGNVFGGMGIRGYNYTSIDAMILIAGMKLNHNYTLSYSYDIGISGLKQFNEGSHELMLNYNLNKLIGVGRDPKIIYNPRFL